MLTRSIVVFLVLLIFSLKAFGAACCGGGSGFPSLILGDDRAQLGIANSYGKIIGDVNSKGLAVFRASADDESLVATSIDGAVLISDRGQAALSIPLAYRARSTTAAGSGSGFGASSFGLGDISATLGYEILPEWSFSKWKPHGFAFVQATLPTGKSIYESRDALATDATGRGFYSFSVGTYLLKSWGSWDAFFRGAIGRSSQRTFVLGDRSSLNVDPSFRFVAALGAAFSPGGGDWRLGLSLNPSYEAASNISSSQMVWNTGADVSRALNRSAAISVAYVDQTLLGPAHNVSLSRTLSLSLRYSWER